ncbi:MAG TPA: phosphatidylserine decarboxylase family protein [Flavobacteriales bacterium]|nr:phosphatidylserine decarboxylase family protein [Flavobacteriales bacterium]
MTLHREGFIPLGLVLVVSALILAVLYYLEVPEIAMWIVGSCSAIVFILFAQFFRIPHRIPLGGVGDVISPSDGKVVVIEKVKEIEYFKDERIQVSVFMSPLNVHCQWSPITGLVKYVKYHTGKYLVAWHPKSSIENERTTLVVEGECGEVLFRQIAGAVARRIRYYIQPGQTLVKGEEVGFIKFGSRIDLYLPLDAEILVNLDDKVTGRETVIATLKRL